MWRGCDSLAVLVWDRDPNPKLPPSVCIQIIFNNKVVSPGFQQNGIVVSRVGIKMYVTIQEIGVRVMFSGLIFSVEVPFNLFANNTEGQCGKLHPGYCLGVKGQPPLRPRGISDCAHMWFTSVVPWWLLCTPGTKLTSREARCTRREVRKDASSDPQQEYTGHRSAAQLADPCLICRHLHQ